MKFMVVAAKTGGHVYPAQALSNEIISNNHEVIVIGTGSNIEKIAFKDLNIKSYQLSIEGFRGKSIFKKIRVIFQIIVNIFKVLNILRIEKIDAMIGFGGFITVPAGISCWILKKPIFLHEQNSVLGSANKLLSNFSKINFLGMPIKNIKNSIITGNPIRESFIKFEENEMTADDHKINIYITGGSQGAEYINSFVPIALKNFSNINIKHQSGSGRSSEVSEQYAKYNLQAEVRDFYDNPVEQILWSDFVISRSGALSISEITSLKRGVLMIPLSNSIDNHQLENAKLIFDQKMGLIHEQKGSLESLTAKIKTIVDDELYKDWKKNDSKIHINASKKILDNINHYLSRK